MSYSEFWDADPFAITFFIEKHRLEAEEKNTWLWLQANYLFEAFMQVESNVNRKKGTQPKSYKDIRPEPYELFTPESKSSMELEHERIRQSERQKAYYMQQMHAQEVRERMKKEAD